MTGALVIPEDEVPLDVGKNAPLLRVLHCGSAENIDNASRMETQRAHTRDRKTLSVAFLSSL